MTSNAALPGADLLNPLVKSLSFNSFQGKRTSSPLDWRKITVWITFSRTGPTSHMHDPTLPSQNQSQAPGIPRWNEDPNPQLLSYRFLHWLSAFSPLVLGHAPVAGWEAGVWQCQSHEARSPGPQCSPAQSSSHCSVETGSVRSRGCKVVRRCNVVLRRKRFHSREF